jgi:hypothetical protein
MAKVRVRLPLGALQSPERINFGGGLHHGHDSCRTRRQDVGKPGIPRASGARDRGFNSRRPDLDCGGACVGTGGRLLSVTTQVRFLPPQPCDTEGQANWRWQPPRKRSSDEPWGFDSLTFRLPVPLAERQRCQPSKLARRVRLPQGTLENDARGSASGRLPGLEPGDGGSTPPPRTYIETTVSRWATRCGVI